jgi:ankyrin repeat protein
MVLYYRWTALYFAAENGDLPMVQFLVANNAAINAADRNG